MITETLYKNFIVGHSPYVLYQIIETDKNIAIMKEVFHIYTMRLKHLSKAIHI